MRRLPGEIEGDAGDALDFVRVVELRVDGALGAVLERHDLLRLAEIDAAGELAHDHDVEAFHHLALERGGIGQRRIADRRAQVGEEAEILAQAQEARLGAHRIGNAIPFRAADGAEEHRIGSLSAIHGGFRDRRAVRVIGRAADEIRLGLEADAPLAEPAHDLLDLAHDLRADAVAGEKEKLVRCHVAVSSARLSLRRPQACPRTHVPTLLNLILRSRRSLRLEGGSSALRTLLRDGH